MADKKKFPKSDIPIRNSSDFLPTVFQTPANKKFLSGVLDPLVQQVLLTKLLGILESVTVKRITGKMYILIMIKH